MSQFQELLSRDFPELSAQQLAALEDHYLLLVRWNQKMNLTRVISLEEAVQVHYAESLLLGRVLPPGALRIADVGSGAGFPGIPIAVLRPESSITLIESHQRKAVFLREASRGLANVRVLSSRAEDVRERFEWVVSRAVTPSEVVALPLADHFAFLLAEEDAPGGSEIQKLPWGQHRAIAVFHVKRFT